MRFEEIDALMKKNNDDVDDVKSEDIEETIEQCDQQNVKSSGCECLKDNHSVMLNESKDLEGRMLELESEMQELQNIAWHSECDACIEKNEIFMSKRGCIAMITEYQKDRKRYEKTH